jgi:putative transferase (TIGR04331 family)
MRKRVLIVGGLRDNSFFKLTKKPVLFLHAGCKLFKIDDHFVYPLIAKYHWDDRKKFNKDLVYINSIYEIYLEIVKNFLNKYHNVEYSKLYWRIIVGPWLIEFISILFDRYETIKNINKNYSIKYVKIVDFFNQKSCPVPKDYQDWGILKENDYWNNYIYKKIILSFRKIKIRNFKLNYLEVKEKKENFFLTKVSFFTKKIINSIIKNNNEIFFFHSYINYFYLFILQIKLGQLPRLWISGTLTKKTLINKKTRRTKLLNKKKDIFTDLLSELIIKNIPSIYLEEYSNAKIFSEKNNWPQRPKYIFSSNAFIYDDIFKIWLAEKKENLKIRFISGQHGGTFFISKYHFHEDHQIRISDNIVTWGYSEKNSYYKKAFNFLTSGKKISPKNKNDNVLFIQYSIPRFSTILNSSYAGPQHSLYLDGQFLFLKKLNKKVMNNLVLRPYKFDFGWDNIARFKNLYPGIRIDNNIDIHNSFKKSKIIVSTLNGTTFLQSLNLNIPTIIFFDKNFDQINNKALPYFKILKKVGIFFDSPELAAIQINKIFDRTDVWWKSNSVQSAVNYFCSRFSRRSEEPLKDLVSLFSRM